MSILSAIKQQNSSIDDLAALPQALIMQMAQKKQISEEMLAPILSRKAEMADAFARQNALKNAGQTPPTVMEQLMAQNAQAEQPQQPQMAPQMPQEMPQQEMPQDMGVAQLPIPERQYAGGGIVAFADGGMSDYEDDDYEDSLEEADYNSMIERAMNAGEDEYTPTFETRQAKGSPQNFANSERSVGIASGRESGDMDARLRAVIMGKESGGRRYDKSGNLLTSNKGAQGEMQVMPYTSRDPGFGVKPAQSDDPNELRRVGDEYASAMLRRYRDPKLAMIAYNMGPGATDKWLASGADPRRLPRETQGYISGVNLAQGGEVKHFQYGGSTMGGFEDAYTDLGIPLRPEIDDYTIDPMTGQKMGSGYRGKKTVSSKAPSETPSATTSGNAPSNQDFRDFDYATALFEAENMGRNAPTQTAQEAPKSRLDQYMEKMMAREAAMDKQRGEDKNMALLTAGLGMLGGTSPYAMANIGQGALAGVQHLREANKQRATEQAGLDKSMLYATRYQGAEDVAKQNAAYNRVMKEKQYQLDVAKHGTEREKIAIDQYRRYMDDQMDALIAKDQVLASDPVAKARARQEIENTKVANYLRQKAFPDLQMGNPTFPGFSAVPSKK
jgi:hypothetical protein